MTHATLGQIASRSMGLLLLTIGLLAAVDYLFIQWSLSQPLPQDGWNNYESSENEINSLHLHDSYTVVNPGLISHIGITLFISAGLIFFIFSKFIGRFIAGKPKSH